MSDVLTQPQAHSTPPPGSGPNPAELNRGLDGRGGGVAVGGGVPGLRAAPNFTPAHERLQRRMENYSSNHINQVKHLNDTANAFNTIVREDTKKLQKKFVDNNKPKKATKNKSSNNEINSSSKASNMKPQIQQANGLKRPHPGANSTSSSTSNVLGGGPGGVSDAASEAKRMNLDQSNNATAIKLEVKQEHDMTNAGQDRVGNKISDQNNALMPNSVMGPGGGVMNNPAGAQLGLKSETKNDVKTKINSSNF